jgi:hypothetical protein
MEMRDVSVFAKKWGCEIETSMDCQANKIPPRVPSAGRKKNLSKEGGSEITAIFVSWIQTTAALAGEIAW